MYIPVPISERLKLKYTNTHNNSLSCPSVLVEDQKQFFCAKAMTMWIFTFTGIYNWTALGSLAIFGNVIKSFEININSKGWGWPCCWSFRMQLLLTNSLDNSDEWRSTSSSQMSLKSWAPKTIASHSSINCAFWHGQHRCNIFDLESFVQMTLKNGLWDVEWKSSASQNVSLRRSVSKSRVFHS